MFNGDVIVLWAGVEYEGYPHDIFLTRLNFTGDDYTTKQMSSHKIVGYQGVVAVATKEGFTTFFQKDPVTSGGNVIEIF
jgi:hypothetical protein